MSWFDIIKEPLISIPKGSVRIKKPKKIETNDECLPKVKGFLKNVSRIIANEPDFTMVFEKGGGHCYVEDFNISEEYACKILEAMSMNSPSEQGGFSISESEGNMAYLDGYLTDEELYSNYMPLMLITTVNRYPAPYNCELNYNDPEPLTSERWSEVLDKIKDVYP